MFDLLNRLKKLSVQLYTEGNDLKIKADPGVMTIALLDEIKLHKAGLLELLKRAVEDDFSYQSGERDDYPLSAQQQAIWLLSQNEQASRSYNIPLIMKIGAQVKTELLEQVIQDVVKRHEAFSTSFFLDNNGEVRQRIGSGEVKVSFEDMRGATDAAVKQALADECMYVFDLTKAPLIKAKIWRRDTEYYLSLLIHHIIFDGASLETLKKDFFTAYEARLKGDNPSFESLVFNYRDFAVWQQEKLEQGHWDHTKAFWEETLAGDLPVIQLFSAARPVTKTSAGMHLFFKVPESLSIAAARFFIHHNVSHFTGLLAVLNALLYRYTGNDDLVLGTVVAGRNFSSLQETIGIFINTVPIRTKLNPEHNFEQLLELQQQVLKDAMHHSQLPFATLVEMLNKKRDASRSPLFDVMVIYNDHKHSESSAGTDFTVMEEDLRATSQFDIVFSFDNTKEGLLLNVEFNTDIYEAATIHQLFRHFQTLLQQLIAAPDAAIHTLDYLPEEEHYQLLHTFNDTAVDYERGVTLPGLFRRQVALQPEATALVFENRRFTYRELDEVSGRLASYLHAHYTLSEEDLIGIKLPRSEWLIISLLAVLKAGCAYVPVDPAYPAERQEYIAEDSGYKVCIDDALLEAFREGTYSPDCYHEVREDQLAYVLYTSGSSGLPKGCMLEHKGLINRLRWMWEHYSFTKEDVVLQKTTFTFDVSVWELFVPLCFGCKMILSSDEAVYSPAHLAALIHNHEVSRAHFVPVMLQRFIEEVDIASLTSLQHVFASGEALPAATVRAWYDQTGVPLSNLYGPTEASIEVSYYDALPGDDKVPIGRPIANTHLHILDQYGQLVPVGISGEVHIGGIQLARGYHHRPELTAEKFIDHTSLNERLYRTGDLGRWLSDGNIEYLGRIDDQVKVRGYRIELGEVEHALKALPGIAMAVVTAYKQSSGEHVLAAYYLSDATQDAVSLRQQLLQKLPEYMVPGHFTQLAALPLTPSGKVDRKALPAPEGGVSATYTAPRNATEAQLVSIWQEVLRTDTAFSITDDFFVQGGHSLKVMQLINHYARHFEVKVSVQDLFHHTTISAHASLLSTQLKTGYSAIQPVAPAPDYAVSDGQRRLWVLSQLEDSSRAYHLSGQMELEGAFQSPHLEAAINQLISRHEILRTVFREGAGGELRQVVLDPSTAVFKLDDAELENEVPAYIAAYSGKVFDLGSFPLLRAGLIRLSSGRHIFHYTMHHIISDGWSMELLREEALSYYNSYVKGEELSLSPLRIQYKDFTAWQQQQVYSAHKDYWETQFAGELPVLELPGSRVRPAVKTYNGYMLSTGISPALTQGLQALCQQQQSTLFMGLLGVLKALFYRYTGQEDIIIGSPVAGREHAELEGQIGFYLNTVALRSRFSGRDNFLSLLSHIRTTTLAAYDHQSYPFDRLVDDLRLKRDTSRSALFDVMMVLQNQQQEQQQSDHLTENIIEKGDQDVKLDLLFTFAEQEDGLYMQVEFNTEIYEKTAIIRLLHHYKKLLSLLVSEPAAAIHTHNYLLKEEQHLLLHVFNDTTVVYEQGATLPELFRRQVAAQPDAVALVYDDHRFTFRELDEWSGRLADYLHTHYHLSAEDLIGIRLQRSEWLIISLLAVLKAGCAYVPVDPSHPQERQDYIARDSGYKTCIDETLLVAFRQDAGVYDPGCYHAVREDQLAYVLYTSGSTGEPKGCMLEHRGLVNRLEWMWRQYGFITADIILQKTTFTFDVSVWELFLPLCWGCKMILSDDEAVYAPARLAALIQTHRVTTMHFVPVLLQSFLEHTDISALASLKRLFTSGEALPAATVAAWYAGSNVPLYNLYGPTEASIDVSYYDTAAGIDKVPIGKPVANTRLHILDSHAQLVPVGVAGELHIGGIQLARGYHQRPVLTAEKFVLHPTLEERLYRTGDLARWLPDGNIEYLGRIDNQVKIRGYRIELGEVEHVLQNLEGISNAVVTVYTSASGERALAAYFTSEAAQDLSSLRQQLLLKLPEYMTPGYFMQLDEFPLTPSGKVNRKALPAPGIITPAEYIAPRNETEAAVARIWQEVLKIPVPVSVTDDFFMLGGHSLKVMQLVNHYVQQFDVKLPVQALFHHTTIASHALLLSTPLRTAYRVITPVAPAPDYAVSDGQRRLWVLSQLEDRSRAYYLSGQLELNGYYQPEHLETAIRLVIQRHEILRTVFRQEVSGELRQVILEPDEASFRLNYADLEEQPVSAIEALITTFSGGVFDLSSLPLLRAGLIRLSAERYIFHYTMHHIISDGWSMELLKEEIMTYYDACARGEKVTPAALVIQYKDFASWQQQQLQSGSYQPHKEYWQSQFSGNLPVLQLPVSKPRPLILTDNGYCLSTVLSEELTVSLKALCRESNATLFMGLLGALKVLLYRYTRQEDIIIGSPVAGREHAALEDQIGFYMNTVALRTRFSGQDSFADLLQQISKNTLTAYEYQSYPFDRLVDELDLHRDRARSPLFDVMLTLQSQKENSLYENYDLRHTDVIKEEGSVAVKFDLHLSCSEMEGTLYMELKYNQDIYDKADISRLFNHYKELLQALVQHPALPVNRQAYLTPAEKQQLLETFNIVTDALPFTGKTVIDLFEEQAAITPESVAVVCDGEQLTYQALSMQANQLAHYLKSKGVGKEDRVVIAAAKSLELIVGFLGIMKAGAAFVPIDPAFPEERIRYVLEDTGCTAVIGDGAMRRMVAEHTAFIDQKEDGPLIAMMPEQAPEDLLAAAQLAYVIYTSGSTGRPKGVMITHGSLTDHVGGIIPRTGLSSCSSFAILASLAADAYHSILFSSLVLGASVHILTDKILFDTHALVKYLEEHTIDGIKIFPSLWTSYAEQQIFILPAKVLIWGGEALPPKVIRQLRLAGYQEQVFNHYGPTEATIGVLTHQVDLARDYTKVPIGAPYSHSRIYILNEEQQLCPVGVTGELHIGGAGLAKGYLNKPELTTEKFIADPFIAGERVYRTGDYARWLADGQVEYIGRIDDQVKINGYRIELGEIEFALQQLKGIQSAVVAIRTTTGDDKTLAAYFTAEDQLEEKTLKALLQEVLPAYMMPHYFIQLDTLPLMANGKVDRKALPFEMVKADTAEEIIAPRNEVEQVLLEVYQQVLKSKDIKSVRFSFFDQGGDSIKAILLASQLKQRGYAVKVGDVLKYPVLEDLATKVQSLNQNTVAVQAVVKGAVALMPVQQKFLAGNYAHKHHYNQSVLLSAQLPVDIKILHRCLAQLVAHHDALRMVYRKEGDSYQQYNRGLEDTSYHLEEHDLTQVADGLTLMEELCESLQRSIDLSQGPLLKAGLFHLTTSDRLLLVIHHLVVDGVSWRILLEDLSTLYQQLSNGKPAQLPQKSDSFRDWAAHQQQQTGSHLLEAEWAYWSSLTAGSGTPLQPDMPAGAHQVGSSATEGFILEEHATRQLLTKAHRAYHTDINDVLLTCLLQAVQDVFEQPHLLLTMEGHGREDIGGNVNISRTVGWFTSMYPVLLESKAGEAAEHTLVRVKDQLRRVPRKGIGYGMLRYLHASGQERLGGLRQSDITFNYLGDFGSGVSTGDGAQIFDYGTAAKGHETEASYEPESMLSVTGLLLSGQLHISVRYGTTQYHGETIRELCDRYAAHLTAIITLLSSKDTVQLTAGDLTYKELDMDRLQALNTTGDITDVYTLSPLQEGLYYHWLSGMSRTMYVEQTSYRLRGSFNKDVLRQSYAYLVNRHAVLRTSFHHGYSGDSIQAVHQHLLPEFRYLPQEISQLPAYRMADREEGFDLHRGPCMRLTVVELNADEYEFIWTHHHILMDGWCRSVLINEFYHIYNSLLDKTSPSLPAVIPYVSYIRWLAEQDVHRSRLYWEGYLLGYEQVAAIPFGEKLGVGYEGCVEQLLLDKELVSGISAFCRLVGITENTFMQGAWSYLLSRYNNTNDVISGAVVSGRPAGLEGVENMIGLFINTIPVRAHYEAETTVQAFLLQLQDSAIDSLPHHHVKLSEIQSCSPLGNRLFDHILVYENYPVDELISDGLLAGAGLSDLSLQSAEVVEQTNYDFTIVIAPASREEGIQVLFRYNGLHYSEAAVQRISAHFRQVLSAFADNAGSALKDLCYLGEEETKTLLHTFNDTAVDYERGVTLPGLFRRQVALQPEATALVFENRRFSYRELDEVSGRLASYLHAHYTLSEEDLIGIKLPRSEWLIISLLAVLKAGCAYVPVDPAYPAERQQYIAEDSGYKVCIDDALLEAFREGTYSPDCYHEVREDQLAYVLYTSGSSGLPKGCMLEHKGLINRLRWMWEHYGFTKEDVVLQKTTFTFDVSVWELFVPLCFGCKMILSSDEAVYSPAHLAALIHNHEVSRAHFVPVMLQRFIEEVDIASLTSLQHVFASGEALPAATVRAWYDQTGVPLSNLYGPTEASIEVSYYDALPGDDKVPIGKPIANTHLHILDQYGQLVPVGIAGEVHIGGIQLARGYHRRPELTAEKFIDHTSLNERLYRTGDLGRWLSDGNIEYLGRIDDQVKVRGYRIELGEVEHALKALPGIAMAVVTAYKQSSGEHVLAAYYLSDATQDAVSLRQQLLQKLPEYMVPGHFTQLAALPLTPSGKVDRKALPAPEGGVSATYTAPRNATEAQLVSIWQEVLRTDTAFSITDDFFVQGGHSLKVMQLINHYARHFEVKVSVQDLFHHTTISAHASLLSTQLKTAYSAIQPVAPAPDYAVSDGQRRLWVLSQLEDSSRAYHLSGQMELEGAFQSPHLEAAINQLIGRHEILRTVFREGAGGELRQVVLDPSAAVFKLDDAELENESEVPAYIAAYSGKVFDLGSFPLLRAGLIRLSSGGYIFHYTMHHIISDGWSMELLREEALSYYNSYVKGEELSLSPLRIQYKDFTAWQQQQVYSAHKSYWETQFAGELPVLELPGSRIRPAVKTYNGYMLSTGISPALTQGLQALCQQQQSTLFMGLLGILKTLFYRYTGQEDIIIGSPVAGREHAELEGQIGFYLNTVALRSRFSGGDNFLSLLGHIRTTTLAAYEHQSYPFDRLVDDLKLKRDTSRSTLFDVFVNVQNIATAATTALPSGQVSLLGPSPSKFDLIFNFHETAEGGLSVYAEFNSDIYDQWFVIRLLEHYQRLLSAVITQPHEALSHLDYLGEEEREQLLYGFNATAKDYGNDATVLDLFRESVTRYGDRTAITDSAATLSYKALDEQSDQVAASLQQRYGIRAGDLVGMRIPRSHRAITLMLGILKAGAGYVPVDMSNPEERTAFIVADSDCRLLVDEKILDDMYAGLLQQSSPSAVVSAESIAYVLYTSGTTGHPKGVLIAHRNLYNYLRYCLDTYFAETEQIYRVPLFTSLSFDLTVTSIYGSLLSGGELIIYDQEQHVGEVLHDIFYGSTRINFMKCTPAHIGLLEEGVTTISQVVVGGEALQPAHINRLHDINPSLVIYNEYGPTETTVGCTVSGIRKGDAAGGITIGVPVSNMQIYILDKEGQPVPAGITGEIYIGGAQVAQGYLNRPELTAAKFVTFAGQRVYRTGDVGRWLPDGQIDYLGRQDDQVKVRGYRIELGEIEHTLQQHPAIKEVMVLAGEHGDDRQLIAFVIMEDVLQPKEIRTYLADKLPDYMVPELYVQVKEFPLTTNGKVDRKKLLEADRLSAAALKQPYVPPGNEVEMKLAAIWKEVLGLEQEVGIKDDLFELGGHSISAIKILARASKEFGVKLSIQKMFATPNIENLAGEILNIQWFNNNHLPKANNPENEKIKV